ncbi:hypothetical protein EMIHUDRAFT_209316 [Emiliania huxleyi CCMP1516]|uniref:Uncharacterized protein n=2 Tax=Emiliania huxleyi TaxID=2903 RepID=A0A0D3J5H6_EMIH1|nr:hypothetical protein EMIHUDRAFT_209316 [Emiliania huxleyi CCMP1516]EOD18761.1 hypothetical protein EMIHUDRAFT_209316 [Emiliania huxleyi CCMP1516]|eukprot:XP_005771190.1 hypothetical protein EMIHUDRAFT_209316 [Emiliania huxleyi CCMP1516]
MLAPAAAPPGRPRVFPQAEKTNPGGSNHLVPTVVYSTFLLICVSGDFIPFWFGDPWIAIGFGFG